MMFLLQGTTAVALSIANIMAASAWRGEPEEGALSIVTS
ncbi:Hypothetical protein A7982_07453 [Minicystis rosea]|nr:Hypothetical protein A7982_07453 [Minicystis rosea]